MYYSLFLMKLQKLLILALGLIGLFAACQQQQGGEGTNNLLNLGNNEEEEAKRLAEQKAKYVDMVAELSCQDTRNLIVKYAGDVVPVLGKFVMDKVIKEDTGEGKFCDCLRPMIKQKLDEKLESEALEEMITKPSLRKQFIKENLVEGKRDVLDCYEEKGKGKGVRLIAKFIDKMGKKLKNKEDDSNTATSEENINEE